MLFRSFRLDFRTYEFAGYTGGTAVYYMRTDMPPRIKQPADLMKVKDAVRYAIKVGKLVKTPCHVCGKEQVEGHHPDYSRPLDVAWLCKEHHLAIHKS